MKIYDGNRLIRTLKTKTPDSTGIYKWTWYMDEAGVDRPSRRIRERRNEPGGTQVRPGTYRLDLHYMDTTTSTTIKVESDPRLDIPKKAIDDAYTASKTVELMPQTVADAEEQLVESKNTAQEFSKRLKDKDKDAFKDEIKASKEIVKKIDTLIALYLGREDDRQGITRNPEVTVVQRIGTASYYSGSRPNGLTSTEKVLMKQARDEMSAAIKETNAFFVTDWPEYKSKMETLEVSPFKETETFKLD